MSDFSIKKIFDKGNVNTILDRLYYEFATAFPEININVSLCLTGRAAAELQGAAAIPCDNIIFTTNSYELSGFMRTKMARILGATAVYFQERTIFYFEDFVLELWVQSEPLTIKLFSGVYVQNLADINPILL